MKATVIKQLTSKFQSYIKPARVLSSAETSIEAQSTQRCFRDAAATQTLNKAYDDVLEFERRLARAANAIGREWWRFRAHCARLEYERLEYLYAKATGAEQ